MQLFLIRRNLENILGPYTLNELKTAFDSMTFGTQDEISSSGKPWIFIEQKKSLKQFYPEVFNLVFLKNSPKHTSYNSRPNTKSLRNIRRISAREREARSSKNINYLAFGFFFAALLIAGFKIKEILNEKDGVTPEYALGLLKKDRKKILVEYIRKNQGEILDNQQEQNFKKWLPLLRWFVFKQNGILENNIDSILRGQNSPHLPSRCDFLTRKRSHLRSISFWDEVLRDPSTQKRDKWVMLLSWDPYVIKRRIKNGWIEPESYSAGCLFTTRASFLEVLSEPATRYTLRELYPNEGKSTVMQIAKRLEWQESVVENNPKKSIIPTEGFLQSLTCLEQKETIQELKACPRERISTKFWQEYLDFKLQLNLVRLFSKKTVISQGELKAIDTNILNTEIDSFTQFPVRAEFTFLKTLLKHKGDIQLTRKRLQLEFPGVQFDE